MLFLVVVVGFFCSSTIQASGSISFFNPRGTGESSCAGSDSWTKWFNEAKPSDNGNFDQELLSAIRKANSRDVCEKPLGMQAKSVGELPNVDSYPYAWLTMNKMIAGFESEISGVDFQVRFCCANTDFVTTTTTTTTPLPITSSTCGRAEIKHSLKSSRIFGGSHATPNSWPWQVLYEERKPCKRGDGECLGVCGGTLIDSRHVLTAAHCLHATNPALITITAGLHNKNNNEADTRQVLTVERIFKHPNYNDDTVENDITILRLAQPVQFNKYVQPACLPGPDPQPDANVVLIGWGATQYDADAYHELKQTKVKVVGDCNKHWSRVDEEKQVCVGHNVTGDSACQGDSGGPMLYEHKGQWVVAGVSSYVAANDCTTYGNSRPNVYCRVSAYLPWIKSII